MFRITLIRFIVSDDSGTTAFLGSFYDGEVIVENQATKMPRVLWRPDDDVDGQGLHRTAVKILEQHGKLDQFPMSVLQEVKSTLRLLAGE